jgi:hypothetical protein
MARVLETDLYLPVKAFLVAQGYEVKAEVGAADIVACRGDEDPVIVELKAAFSLTLFHQAIRTAIGHGCGLCRRTAWVRASVSAVSEEQYRARPTAWSGTADGPAFRRFR